MSWVKRLVRSAVPSLVNVATSMRSVRAKNNRRNSSVPNWASRTTSTMLIIRKQFLTIVATNNSPTSTARVWKGSRGM